MPTDLRGCLLKVVWCYNWEKLLRMSEETTQKAKEVLDLLQECVSRYAANCNVAIIFSLNSLSILFFQTFWYIIFIPICDPKLLSCRFCLFHSISSANFIVVVIECGEYDLILKTHKF